MDIEDLMNVTVTSASKREQKLSRTAAAIFVINQEDIRRSGAANIPDLLRMAPGVDVQQIDANAWAISIRGFNSRYSNKVLVMIDGRTVYTNSFSGVYWEQIDVPLENIDRIEVIRGPGASVWGANAVNGVISIFTKSSKDTKGGLVSAAGGSQLHASGLAQYGGSIGSTGSYRAFAQGYDIGNSALANGSSADDHWSRGHAGFRSDWAPTKSDSLMVLGDLFDNAENETRLNGFIASPVNTQIAQHLDAAGGDVLARWNHDMAGGSQTSFQAYYDTYRRTDYGVPEKMSSVDLDFQDRVTQSDRHSIVWGLGYRFDNSSAALGHYISFSPPVQRDNLFSAFLQDEIRVAQSLWITLGAKLEHNSYSGLETEPSVRLVWYPVGSHHMIWASASKALRQPARSDTATTALLETIPIAPDIVQTLQLVGNPHIRDEELRDYELGYRSDLSSRLSLDVTTFLSFYHHLETIEPQALNVIPSSPLVYQIPMMYENLGHAVDYGGEIFLNWSVSPRWRISPGYSYLHATLRQDPSSQGLQAFGIASGFPQNMFQTRSQVNLSSRTEFDQSLYYTARLPGSSIPGHVRLDLRLSRRIGESVELSLVGQNLLRPRAMEYGDTDGIIGTQALRSVYGKITWRF